MSEHIYDAIGNTSGEPTVRNTRLLMEAISVSCMAGSEGWIIAPPNALLYAVEPDGVDIHSPSPRNRSKWFSV